jgi:hypothetical protein
MDDLERAEFSISLIGNSVIDLPFGLMALKGNEGKPGEKHGRPFIFIFEPR